MSHNRIQLSRDTRATNKPSESIKQLRPSARKVNEEGLRSQMGYSDDSYYMNEPYIDIVAPTGIIDMSKTSQPLLTNGKLLPALSGLHQFGTTKIREIPFNGKPVELMLDDNEIAQYKAKGYQIEEYQNGGEYTEDELTDEEINELRSKGYRIEEI
jgi:hypothetical protein